MAIKIVRVGEADAFNPATYWNTETGTQATEAEFNADQAAYVNPWGVKNPQPGFGTAEDTQGYFWEDGSPGGGYKTYADMLAEGLGAPTIRYTEAPMGDSGPPGFSGNMAFPNEAMLAKYPRLDREESFFAPFLETAQFFAPFAAASGIGGGLNALAQGGSFFGNAGGMLGDAWSGLTGPANATANAAGSGATSGGNMAFDVGAYDPLNPFDFGAADQTLPGGISEAFTGSGFPSSGGSFAGYDFGLGYPVGGDQVVNLAGGGLTDAAGGKLFQGLLEKVGPTAAKSLFSRFLGGDASALDVLGAAAPGLISEFLNSQRASSLESSLSKIAETARADRSPFLDYAKSTLAGGPGAYATTGPGGESLKAVLAKLSAGFGNPIGSPVALGIATDSANRTWQDDWRQAANIGLGGNYSQLATNAAAAGNPANVGAGFGDAAASVFATPKTDLASLARALKEAGLA